MPARKRATRPRGTPIVLLDWWIDAARVAMAARWGSGRGARAKLAEAILGHRGKGFNALSTKITRFFYGESEDDPPPTRTVELADAIRRVLDLPGYVFFPRNQAESERMRNAQDHPEELAEAHLFLSLAAAIKELPPEEARRRLAGPSPQWDETDGRGKSISRRK
jgi:hypothetical protein